MNTESRREKPTEIDPNIERGLNLISHNIEEVKRALKEGSPDDQADQISQLIAHMRAVRQELLPLLQRILKENPGVMSTARKIWLEAK